MCETPTLRASQLARCMRPVPQELVDFMSWYLKAGSLRLKPPQDGVLFQQRPGTSVVSVVLYRDPPFQVELVTFPPGASAPLHRHDHIDTCEVVLAGGMNFIVDGRQVGFAREPRADGSTRDLLKWVPIPRDAYHGGAAGPQGGCFLSVQMWRDMPPTHVGLEWQDQANEAFA